MWQATHSPVQQRVARELIFADPLVALHAYRGRALVVSAANDAQVPGSDADRIFAALGSDAKDKVRVTIANANHVYKSETRAPSDDQPGRDRRRLRRREPPLGRRPRRRDRGLRHDDLRQPTRVVTK